MAKKQSFADKASKKKHVEICPVCNTALARVKWVRGVTEGTSVRYRTNTVGICKCNEKQIYG